MGSAVTRVRVWDLPLRLFHWTLFVLVAVAFVSAQVGGNAMVWHGRAGLAVLGLVAFRVVWGFVGSTHARFASFVRGPAAIRAYLKGQWNGLGHNPLGALSVLALLTLLAVQAATGLFADDEIAFQGYLYPLVGSAASSRITAIHKLFEPALIVLVSAHILAIAFYLRVKRTNLVKPMITGWTEVEGSAPRTRGGGIAAFFYAASIAGLCVYLASGALLPPPPPPAAETPAW
jgi:cytochrome b